LTLSIPNIVEVTITVDAMFMAPHDRFTVASLTHDQI